MSTASLRTEGLVPLGLEDVWRLLSLHMDEETVRAIHPWVLSGRLVRDEGRTSFREVSLPSTHVVDREIRIAGRRLRDTWTYAIAPPETFTYEVRSPEGLVSRFRNSYREEGSGTRVLTDATLEFGRIPRFVQRRIGGGLLERADAEDLAYLRRYGFRTIREATRPKGT